MFESSKLIFSKDLNKFIYKNITGVIIMPKERVIKPEVHVHKKTFQSFYYGKSFPTFATIVLVIGFLWLLSDLKIITIEIPWFPLILIIIAIGWIVNRYSKK